MKKYLKTAGYTVFYLGFYYLTLLAISYFYLLVLVKLPGIGPWLFDNRLIGFFINDPVQVALMFLFFKYFRKLDLFEHSGFKRVDTKLLIAGFFSGSFVGAFSVAMFKLDSISSAFPSINEFYDTLFLKTGGLIVFALFLLVGAVYKEILFRGLILNELRTVLPIIAAVIIDGLLYGLMFFSLDIGLTIVGIIGCMVFSAIYISTGSIWPSILAQVGLQGTQYVLWHTGKWLINDSNVMLFIALFFIGAVASIVWLLMLARRVTGQGQVVAQ